MSALVIHTDEELGSRSAGADVSALWRAIAPGAGSRTVAGTGRIECTCPHDCERDHPNE
jgi:hypothetical protein